MLRDNFERRTHNLKSNLRLSEARREFLRLLCTSAAAGGVIVGSFYLRRLHLLEKLALENSIVFQTLTAANNRFATKDGLISEIKATNLSFGQKQDHQFSVAELVMESPQGGLVTVAAKTGISDAEISLGVEYGQDRHRYIFTSKEVTVIHGNTDGSGYPYKGLTEKDRLALGYVKDIITTGAVNYQAQRDALNAIIAAEWKALGEPSAESRVLSFSAQPETYAESGLDATFSQLMRR